MEKFQIALDILRARYKFGKDFDRPLIDLARFLETKIDAGFKEACLDFDEQDALAYMRWSAEQDGSGDTPRAIKTQKNYLATLKRFFNELELRGLIEENPFRCIRSPRGGKQKRPTRYIDPEIVTKMLYISRGRARAILAVFFGGGLRVGELVRLNLSDCWLLEKVEDGVSTWRVVLELTETKNGQTAQQLLPDWSSAIVWDHVEKRLAEAAGDPHAPLFCRMDRAAYGGRLTEKGARRQFQRIAKLAGVEGWIGSHSARATAITQLLEQGKTHREVMQFSRHGSVQMVELYDKKKRRLEEHPGAELTFEKPRRVV